MRYNLEASRCTDKETTFAYIQELLQLPDYMGHNLDGLWDVLGDMDNMEIVVRDARYLLDNLGDYGRQLLDLLGDLHNETGHSVVFCW